jgi:hypothetical protein
MTAGRLEVDLCSNGMSTGEKKMGTGENKAAHFSMKKAPGEERMGLGWERSAQSSKKMAHR